ncbi:MAG: PEP-CTERM sorting domain-containing protein [bacterium]
MIGVFLAAIAIVPVAQAYVVDLTTLDASGVINGATFMQNGHLPNGSGVSRDFLRLGTGNTGIETGFNTDARPLGPDLTDVNSSLTFTHSLMVSDLATLNGGNVVFRLDINQANARPLLSMDFYQIWTAATGDINSLADLTSQNLVYDMGPNKVYLNYSLESGSGESDMDVFMPSAWFQGHEHDYLYLRVTFGATGGDYAANDGPEQFSALTGTPTIPVPEASTFLLTSFGLGFIGIGLLKKRLG